MALLGTSYLFVAYIGPGAGFAFLGSFLILFAAIVLAALSLLLLPFRLLFGLLLRRRRRSAGAAKRVVIVGMDGLDPARVRKLITVGDLPAFAQLAKKGSFSDLSTTCPPISPAAWSSFATGTNPGKHNIFDFLNRDLRTCIPDLSSCRVTVTERKGRLFGRRRADVALLRRSKPFWRILGENGVFSTVLRVPVTFPPEPFEGLMLSGTCVPDLRGTQGSFTVYEMSDVASGLRHVGGRRIVVPHAKHMATYLPGPPSGDGELRAAFTIDVSERDGGVTVRVCGRKIRLRQGVYSDWVRVVFRSGLRRITGICRFLLVSAEPAFRLYVTPVNIDPERPAMPISHPRFYSAYLAKLHGPFATLGLAEDTWALNEGILDELAFLRQAYDIHDDREEMFIEALKRTRAGLCCCVFDLSDRIQHMFYRQSVETDSGGRTRALDAGATAIDDAYRRLDALLKRTMDLIDDDTILFVMSDHGFRSFRRGINLNVWLREQGYLVLRSGATGGEYLADVDWSKTKAYSFGLAGIYVNMKGREARGIVADGAERHALKAEIIEKLGKLRDPVGGDAAISALYDSDNVYSGPYRDNGPDIVVGYADGYRASWECAVGGTAGDLFADNRKCWSGDHCVDHRLVPGVLFCNRQVDFGQTPPAIVDVAPTVLELFGISPPPYMDGRAMKVQQTPR
jgi:predicted AlkP superfamily phosphohydrolase/phosphomutase